MYAILCRNSDPVYVKQGRIDREQTYPKVTNPRDNEFMLVQM